MDDAAREYFRTIEERFIERRGRPLLLSPADVALVRDWHRQGIPLQAVLEAIDVHFERLVRRGRAPRRAVTLAYLEDDVVDAWAGVKRRRLGRATVTADAAGQKSSDALATRAEHDRLCRALEDALARSAGSPLAEGLRVALEKLRAKADLFDETRDGHDDEKAEDHLRRLEKSLLERAREALGAEAVAGLARAAEASLADKRSRMDERNLERAVAQLVDRSLRERLGIPRLSLFYA